jgi:hypothetical protein
MVETKIENEVENRIDMDDLLDSKALEMLSMNNSEEKVEDRLQEHYVGSRLVVHEVVKSPDSKETEQLQRESHLQLKETGVQPKSKKLRFRDKEVMTMVEEEEQDQCELKTMELDVDVQMLLEEGRRKSEIHLHERSVSTRKKLLWTIMVCFTLFLFFLLFIGIIMAIGHARDYP